MKHILFLLLVVSICSCGDKSVPCTVESVEFYGTYDMDSMKIKCTDKEYIFPTIETVFDTINGFDIKIENTEISPYCTRLITQNQNNYFLTMERPDFAGPVINLIDLNSNEPIQIWSIQRKPIEIFNAANGKCLVAVQLISGEPGFQDGYYIENIPLFELYELKSGGIELDETATEEYNLKHFDDFETIQIMANPVYGIKGGERKIIEEN